MAQQRRPKQTALLALASCLAAYGCPAPESPQVATQSADHHLHIRSQAAAEHQDRVEEALGESRPDQRSPSAGVTAAEAIEALDAAGIRGGLVFSNAYMFGMPEAEVNNESQWVRAENEYVAAEVARYRNRLLGFCSFNPLKAYALEELERCAADERIAGLKLHLTNSDVDLRDPAHVEALAAVFGLANRLLLPVVVHMRSRAPDYGTEDAQNFIDQILSQAPDVPVQIAHMAGWGGYDDAADEAMSAFVDAMEEGRLRPDRVTFGLGAVVFQPEAAGADTVVAESIREANDRLAARIREIGVERVVYSTDWPSWPPIQDPAAKIEGNLRLIRSALPLNETELEQLLANVGPIFTFGRR